MKKNLISLFILIMTALQAEQSIQKLDLGEADAWNPLILNEMGQIAGTFKKNNKPIPFFWSESTGLVEISNFPKKGSFVRIESMNNLGHIVGCFEVDHGWIFSDLFHHGFFWSQDTGVIDLGRVNNENTYATSINDQGKITLYNTGASILWPVNGSMWDNGNIISLSALTRVSHVRHDYGTGIPLVINNNDQIAFSQLLGFFSISVTSNIYDLRTGQTRLLDTLEGSAWVENLNDQGTVLGGVLSKDKIYGFMAFADNTVLNFENVSFYNLNNKNSAVGSWRPEKGLFSPVLVQDGEIIELNKSLEELLERGSILIDARDINDHDVILGVQYSFDDDKETVVLIHPE